MRKAILAVAVLLTTQSAMAETKGVAIYFGAALADVGSTELALGRNPNAYEANPLMRGTGTRIATRLAVAGGLSYLDSKASRKQKWILRGAVLVLGGYATWNNLRRAK